MGICYWCGQKVSAGKGAREHIVPKTLFQDTDSDLSHFIISKENSHRECNKKLGDKHEHDFCQVIFYYSFNHPNAKKHNDSKKRNLKTRLSYASKQFSQMKLLPNALQIEIPEEVKNNFTKVIEKIIKGLFLNRKVAI